MEKSRHLIYPCSVRRRRINELPDDLLVLILSRLTMKEAARASVLSCRWEHLWVYYSGTLNFDNVNKTFNTRRSSLSIERPRFISWVNHVLNLLQASTVDELRVCFDLDARCGDDIDRWIKFAVEKTVSKLELDFSEFHAFNINKLYPFPKNILDSPNILLRFLGSLTSLRLKCVDLSDEVLAYLISNCQSLEHLSIIRAGSLTYLNVTTALKLKHLEIEYCYNLKNVDIEKTNIESLKFNGNWKLNSSLENLHLLREVSLCGQWCFNVVWLGFWSLPISQLQRLELDMGDSIYSGHIKFPEVFSSLCNLKHLEVTLGASHNQNIFCLTSLICACPLLSSFTLKVLYAIAETSSFEHLYGLPNCEWRKSEKRNHECLKVVKYIGWHGYESEFDIVKYLIEKSTVLEKLIIDSEQEKVPRERAKLLQKYVSPGMELVIL